MDSIPGRGGKIPHAVENSQEILKKQKTLKDGITGRRKGRCYAWPGLENQVGNLSLVLSENISPKYVRYRCTVTPENNYFTEKSMISGRQRRAVLKRDLTSLPRN